MVYAIRTIGYYQHIGYLLQMVRSFNLYMQPEKEEIIITFLSSVMLYQ